ncbi:MAG: trypsin-like peptidase domain-containing protein [Tepidiformaceae bacterium]
MLKARTLVFILAASLLAGCSGGDDTPKPSPTSDSPTAVPATATPATLDAATILDRNKNSVVNIITSTPNGEGGGTGVVWEDATHILTAAHVVIGAGAIKVVDPNEGSRTFPAKVVGLSACDDIAVLSVDRAQNLKPATIGDSETVKPGDHVVTLGFPATISSGPNTPILSEGNVSRVHASFGYSGQSDLIQHAIPTNPGNSGGPLFNNKGEVVAIHAYAARNRQNENYAIAIDEAKTVAKAVAGGKNLDYIGISITPNDPDFADQNDLAYTDGLVITAIDPGSAAAKAKPYPLEVGNLIFEVNSTPVETVGQFCDVLRSHTAGQTLQIRFGAYGQDGNPFNNFIRDLVIE